MKNKTIILTICSILVPVGLFFILQGKQLPQAHHQHRHGPVKKGSQEEQIQAVISHNMKEIVACYNQRLRHGLDKMGDLKMGWDIDESGVATNFREIENQLEDTELYDCSSSAISQWAFPKGIYFKVHYAFHLKYKGRVPAKESEEVVANLADMSDSDSAFLEGLSKEQ